MATGQELVDRIGGDGSSLGADPTLDDHGVRGYPRLLVRRSLAAGPAACGGRPAGRAADRAGALLASHPHAPGLPDAVAAEIREIVAHAEARAGL